MSSNNSSWLENKMKGLRSTRSRSPSVSGRRSRSASPAPQSQLPPATPLGRMPSSEALDRSIHNAIAKDDGSEKSKDEIIAKLRKANAALTDKTAEMEATFMNQCNVLASEISEQAETIRAKDEAILSFNARLVAIEDKSKGKDSLISKLRTEKSFQKQATTDLKNQLFQMQNDLEEVEFSKSEEIVALKKNHIKAEQKIAELEKEKSTLMFKVDAICMERDQVKSKMAELKVKREEEDEPTMSAIEVKLKAASPARRPASPARSITGDSVASQNRQNWMQLEVTRDKLKVTEEQLHETQSALATTEHKHKSALNQIMNIENEMRAAKLESETKIASLTTSLQSKDEEIDRFRKAKSVSESENREKIQNLENQTKILETENKTAIQVCEDLETQLHGDRASKEKQISELKNLLNSRDDIIANLHERLEGYNNDLTNAEQEIDDLTSQVDADKVKQMATDLEEAGSLLEKERKLTASLTEKYEVLCGTVKNLQNETDEFKNAHGNVAQVISDKDDQIRELEEDLSVFRSSLSKEKETAKMLVDLKSSKIGELEEKLQDQALIIQDAHVRDAQNSADQAQMQKLEAEIVEIKNEKKKVEIEFEKNISATEAEVEHLRNKIDAQLRKITTMEGSYSKEISKLSSEIAILRHTTEEGSEAQETLHEMEVTNLRSQIESLNAFHAQEMLEARQDIESREETWNEDRTKMQSKIFTLESELSALLDTKKELESAKQEINMLKSMDLEGEVQKLRRELQIAKEGLTNDDGELPDSSKLEKHSTGKRAYLFSIEKKHKKELAEVEIKRKQEFAILQQKLSDRDKTIATTIQSSMSQDQEIKKLQLQIAKLKRGPQAQNPIGMNASSFADRCEIQQLQTSVKTLGATKSSMSKEIVALKKQISDAKIDKLKVLSSSPPRALTKELNACKLKLQERDGAIATLVKSSITQEQQITALREEIAELRGSTRAEIAHGNGPSWQEYTRLQQESEMFAGQIIELDEEIEDLRQRLYDEKVQIEQGANLANVVEELGNQVQEQKMIRSTESKKHENKINAMKAELKEENELRKELTSDIKNLKDKLKKSSKLERVQDELDEVEDSNHKLQQEVRDLRRKVRSAQLEAEKVPQLEFEISEMQKHVNRMKIHSVKRQADEVVDIKRENDLQRTKGELAAKEAELKNLQVDFLKLEDSIVQCQEKELKLQGELNKLHLVRSETEKELHVEIDTVRTRNKQLSEAMELSESKARRNIEGLKDKMKDLENDIDEQNEIISALTNEVKKLRSNSTDDSEANDIIIALTDEVKKLRSKQMSDQGGESDVIKALSEEVRSLHSALKQKEDEVEARDIEATVRAEVGDELRSMKSQKEFLGNEVSRLQSALDRLEADESRISTLQKQSEDAEKERINFEKTMMSTYERKLNLMQMNKDFTIDGLRKDLAQCKEARKEVEKDLLNKIRTLMTEKKEIESELEAKMQHKNNRIKILEQTNSAYEQVSDTMKDEMDHLQNSMENVSVSRRAEVEELQTELMSTQAKVNKYERKITSLKMEVEDLRLQHRNEVSRLEHAIQSMESDTETPMMRDVAMDRERRIENDYRQQLKDLMTKVNILQEENVSLKHQSEKEGRLRSSTNDKWRNSALQEQVIRLQARLKEYEGDAESTRSSSSRRSIRNDSTPRIPRTPSGSYRRESSSRNSNTDEISTYTEQTF